jgi:hypothetical protein
MKFLTSKEIQNIIQEDLNARKAPVYDPSASGNIERNAKKGIVYLTTICNAIIRKGYFPSQWKLAQIIIIPKPCKPLEEFSTYRPISLLPVLSKIFKKLCSRDYARYLKKTESFRTISLCFDRNTIIEQVHRITQIIIGILEKKRKVLLCGLPGHHTSF